MIDPIKLADAMDAIFIMDNSRLENDVFTRPTVWFVVDGRTADESVGYPGDLISEHESMDLARIGKAVAIIHCVIHD